jgi:hypothetical protein
VALRRHDLFGELDHTPWTGRGGASETIRLDRTNTWIFEKGHFVIDDLEDLRRDTFAVARAAT